VKRVEKHEERQEKKMDRIVQVTTLVLIIIQTLIALLK